MSDVTPPGPAPWGERLFRARGWLPVPLALALALLARPVGPGLLVAGALVQLAGLALRLWGVAHIGPGSRRRSAEVGALALSGPYRFVRNPLYLGNLACWAGLALWTGAPLALPLALVPLGLHYHLIVGWEEGRLAETLGSPYIEWAQQTPRWWPSRHPAGPDLPGAWGAALRSERSTYAVTLLLGGVVLGAGAWARTLA